MGTLTLLLIALAAVAVLLVLVIKVELPAFVAMLLVSMGTALVAGIPINNVVPVMVAGMGKVLGSVAIVVGVVGYFAAKLFKVDAIKLGDSPAMEATIVPSSEVEAEEAKHTVPSAAMVVGLILLPIALIMIGSVLTTILPKAHVLTPYASFIGAPTTALLTGLLVAYVLIGNKAKWGKGRRSAISDSALPIVAIIIFVTGAGGVFGNVLVESGIGKALSDSLTALGLPLIVAAFVISLALRAAQGSATVAILTTAGLLSQGIAAGGYSPVEVALITLAIGFGGLGLSHINDSGFWIVTKYLGLSVADGLKTWTVLTTICGVTGFLLTGALWLVV